MTQTRRWTTTLATLLLAVAVTGCGQPVSGLAGPRTLPVAVDTDMGADDILAILYLLGRSDVDIVAVTVDGDGLTTCPAGGTNALRLLSAAGRPDIPVACGSNRPISGEAAFPKEWRTQADQLYGMSNDWPTTDSAATDDPVALLAEAAKGHPGLRVLALGPLTTVAQALGYPGVAATKPSVIVSGGAVAEPGNMPAATGPAVAEWNIGVDPTAAQQILLSGLPTRWVGLDATNDAPVDIWFVRALSTMERGRVGDIALDFLQANPDLSRGGFYFWDPVAAVAAVVPGVVVYRPVTLAIRNSGTDVGRTVTDPGGTVVDVAIAADVGAFATAMLQAFGNPETRAGSIYESAEADIEVAWRQGAFWLDAPAELPTGDRTVTFDGSGGAFVGVVGRVADDHSYADVQTTVRQGVSEVPPWFTVVASVDVPAGSRPTWILNLTSGSYAIVTARPDGTSMTALGEFIVRR